MARSRCRGQGRRTWWTKWTWWTMVQDIGLTQSCAAVHIVHSVHLVHNFARTLCSAFRALFSSRTSWATRRGAPSASSGDALGRRAAQGHHPPSAGGSQGGVPSVRKRETCRFFVRKPEMMKKMKSGPPWATRRGAPSASSGDALGRRAAQGHHPPSAGGSQGGAAVRAEAGNLPFFCAKTAFSGTKKRRFPRTSVFRYKTGVKGGIRTLDLLGHNQAR